MFDEDAAAIVGRGLRLELFFFFLEKRITYIISSVYVMVTTRRFRHSTTDTT